MFFFLDEKKRKKKKEKKEGLEGSISLIVDTHTHSFPFGLCGGFGFNLITSYSLWLFGEPSWMNSSLFQGELIHKKICFIFQGFLMVRE